MRETLGKAVNPVKFLCPHFPAFLLCTAPPHSPRHSILLKLPAPQSQTGKTLIMTHLYLLIGRLQLKYLHTEELPQPDFYL